MNTRVLTNTGVSSLATLRMRLAFLTAAIGHRGSLQRVRGGNLAQLTYATIAATIGESHWKGDFGVTLQEFNAIHDALQLPSVIKTRVPRSHQIKVNGVTGC